jgi:alpha-ketoglutarate-dependent taurine dioxygenase/4-hydroxybenzoate polyprenyltransferase
VDYTVEEIQPFGAIIKNNSDNFSIEQFSTEQLENWVSNHKLIVFRGYTILPKQKLALFGQKLGKPLQWAFGAINELKVKPDTENYIFTDHEVPLHWDGAFVGTIPHIILFQCVTAPKKEDLGGTTFSDTNKILENLSSEKMSKWKNVTITYSTKKIVHYGGKIKQKLIQKHELENKLVIRYAEPVNDLNPVSLDIKGLHNQTPDSFITEMKSILYDSHYLYTHRWEKNDIVLADNHTLLHGREAFKNPNERYIQRINILQRPKSFSLIRYINNCLTIRRKEFFVAELPIFIIPLLLSINSWNDFLQPTLYIGLLAIILLFNIGDMINCYADYELDSIYKSHLSNAVFELGKKNVLIQIVLSGIIAMLLTIVVSILTKQYYLIALTLVGAFIGLQYSIKPFKFKSKGIWQLFCLWGIIFFGPMLYTAIISHGFPTIIHLCIFITFGFHQMGIIMLNTAEDFTEDKDAGLHTIIVSLGLHKAMNVAWILVLLSGLALQLLVFQTFVVTHSFSYVAIVIFTIGWLKIVFEYKKVLNKIKGKNDEDTTKELKKNGMKVPEWLKIGSYALVISIVLIKLLDYAL